jgi:hypothetical protein
MGSVRVNIHLCYGLMIFFHSSNALVFLPIDYIIIGQLLQLALNLNIYLNSHFQSLVKEEESGSKHGCSHAIRSRTCPPSTTTLFLESFKNIFNRSFQKNSKYLNFS